MTKSSLDLGKSATLADQAKELRARMRDKCLKKAVHPHRIRNFGNAVLCWRIA